MEKVETFPFDGAEFFAAAEDQEELLREAFETGHAGFIANAFGVVARARGMTKVAKEAGVTRMALYKGLHEAGDPRLSTLLGLARALGFKITVQRVADAAE